MIKTDPFSVPQINKIVRICDICKSEDLIVCKEARKKIRNPKYRRCSLSLCSKCRAQCRPKKTEQEKKISVKRFLLVRPARK